MNKEEAVKEAKKKFYRIYWDAVLFYEANPSEANRARWTKEWLMCNCGWPYPEDWRTLGDALEGIGLILYLPGARSGWASKVRPWTFATCVEDREWYIAHAAAVQVGTMKRTAKVIGQAIAPPDERHALEEGSKERIDKMLKKQNVKLEDVLRTIRHMKQDLLDRETRRLLAEYGE